MPQKQFGNVVVDVDAEGFMTNQAQWTREVAAAIAREEGIAELTPSHWKVIEFMQKEFKETGQAPSDPEAQQDRRHRAPRSSTSSSRAGRPRRRPRSPA